MPRGRHPALDDSSWREVKLPGRWSDINVKGENAYGWYRRHIEVPAELRGKEVLLLIGKVDDVDETFVNGTRVGGMGSFPPAYQTAWDQVRRYRVPANLFKCDGTDVIAVRDYNGQADAGIIEAASPVLMSGPFSMDSSEWRPAGLHGRRGGMVPQDLLPARRRARAARSGLPSKAFT